MTREEAEALAGQRNRSGGDALWGAQQRGSGWRVVRVTLPGSRVRPSGAHVESKPEPNEPADPRSAFFQNIPPYGAG